MCKILVPILLLALLLVACADTAEPVLAPATQPSTTATFAAMPAATAVSRVAATASLASEMAVTASPMPKVATTAGVTTPAPDGDLSPWPLFLRGLDFGIPAGNSYGPRALAIHPGLGRLYVRTQSRNPDNPQMGLVTVLDLESGDVLAVAETGLDSYSEGAVAVDPVLDRVYTLNPGETTCAVLDARSLQAVETLDGVDQFALDVEGRRLYVAGLSRLRLLDSFTYETLRQSPPLQTGQFLALAVDPVANRLYLAGGYGASYTLNLYDADSLESVANLPLPGRPDSLLADPDRQRLFLTLNDGESSLLWFLDSDGRLLEERRQGTWTQDNSLALDREGGRLFVGREVYRDHGVAVVDLETGQTIADIPLDQSPNALTWDGDGGRLLVSQMYANRLAFVDVVAGEVSALVPTAINLVDLAVDGERGHLYVTDTAGRLHVMDSDTDEVLAVLPGEGRISVDSAHGRLYTGGQGADRVRVFDTATLQQSGEIISPARPVADAYHGSLYLVRSGVYLASLETMTITGVISDTLPESPGYSPSPAAVDAVVDPGSGRLFAIINNGVPGSNNGNHLYVYEPDTYEKMLDDRERSPIYVDIDPGSGLAYVSRIHLAGRSTSLLAGGREYVNRLDAVFGALRVDPALGRVYMTLGSGSDGQILALDAANLDVLGTVAGPSGFSLRALDPVRHLLYLAADSGQVQVWSAFGGQLPAPVEPVPADLPSDGAQRLFLGPGDNPLFAAVGQDGNLYQSDDEGASWRRITDGLPDRWVQEVRVSPAFAQDQTLFVALLATDEGLGVWKSADGGRSWRMANRGLSDLAVSRLAMSPAFDSDQTLFATARRGGLYRSTDGGQTWIDLTDHYYPADAYQEQPGGVFLSPTYAEDRTVFVNHAGLRRSVDGGETWSHVLGGMSSLEFSPAFVADRTMFGWLGGGGVLRSTDGGDTWQAVSMGLALVGFGSGRIIVSPDFATSQVLYFIWTPSAPDMPDRFYRSTDAAASWQQLVGSLPQASTPVELNANGTAFVALDDTGRLARWPADGLDWQPAALPPLAEVDVHKLLFSPDFGQDRTLHASSESTGILRSGDAGLAWADAGFPLRMTYGGPPGPVVAPSGDLFVGTPLGLYQLAGDGAWTLVGDGLPQGVSIDSPQIGADGSLRVLASGKEESEAQRVFLSTDGGQSWTQPVPALPVALVFEDLRLSPALATDHTAFIALTGQKPLRTSGGSDWEAVGPPGEWRLSALHLSPAFDRDGLLFVRLEDGGLWRSTDRGDSWIDVSGPWGDEAPMGVSAGMGYVLPAVTFSPAYAQDGVLLTRAGNIIYHSTDRGETWTRILELGFSPSRAVFSPDYARDGAIYLLQGRNLYRSVDRGRTWRALPLAPWDASDEIRLELSPAYSQDGILVAWTSGGGVYQSRDRGQSWRDVRKGLVAGSIRQVCFSPDYRSDGLLYLVPYDGGLFKRVGDGAWLPVTERVPSPTPEPQPTPTSGPPACDLEPSRFHSVWQQAGSRLGCPLGEAVQVQLAEQAFEHGRMIWDSSSRQIYVLLNLGSWQAFEDTFVEGADPAYDPTLPPPPQQPQRGFGKVWREQLGGRQSAIGWAVEDERPVEGWRQRFERGQLIWTDATPAGSGSEGSAYLLYRDGTWQVVGAPPP